MTIRSLTELRPGAVVRADVAIVGAGPAGITLASELDQRGISVALLEAGSRDRTLTSQRRYEGAVVTADDLEYPPLDEWRLRMFGGTSNHWAGWCAPIRSDVFAPRPWIADAAWPFSLDADDPDVRRAHERCELGRFEYDATTITDDLGVESWPSTDEVRPVVFRYSPPTRFGERYGPDLEASPVDVVLDANLVAVRHGGGVVRGLEVVSGPGRDVHVVEADHVVLACGGLETIRLLLLLQADGAPIDRGDHLGRCFLEHPHGVVGQVLLDPVGPARPECGMTARITDVDGTEVRFALAVTPDAAAEHGLVDASVTLVPRRRRGDIGGVHTDGVVALERLLTRTKPLLHDVFVRAEQRPVPESRVWLGDEVDDLGLRRLVLDWRLASGDRTDLSQIVDLVGSAIAGAGLGTLRNALRTDERVLLTGGAHHMGGARMADDPVEGVVDPTGRVHGLGNLHVCSAAVFPTSGHANPTLSIVALALRLARTLAEAS